MNLYFLVEGRRTEAIVYPEWLKYLLPEFERVEELCEVVDNHYILMSGYGYPNILYHLENAVKDIKESGKFDYLIVCIDADDECVKMREGEVLTFLKEREISLEKVRLRVIVQKRCIESWFLGNRALSRADENNVMRGYLAHYDIFRKDPEEMRKPHWYKGSIGAYHVDYLCTILNVNGRYYSKKRPYVVCERSYFSELQKRAETTYDLGTLRHFLRLCEKIRQGLS